MLGLKRAVSFSKLTQRNLFDHSVVPLLNSTMPKEICSGQINWTHYTKNFLISHQHQLPQKIVIRNYSIDQQQSPKQESTKVQTSDKIGADVPPTSVQPSASTPSTTTPSTGDEEINKENLSSEELLLKLAKKSKTAHLLKPKTLNEKVSELSQKGVEILLKTPGWIIKFLGLTITKSWEFAKNPSVAKEWWEKVVTVTKRELHHYVYGFKLFGADVAYGAKLLGKLTTGNSLSRRERTQV